MRTSLTAAGTVLAAVGALTVAFAPAALAASGTFTYHDSAGKRHTISDPSYSACYKLDGNGLVENHTNAMVMLFTTTSCRGHFVPIHRGGHVTARFASAMVMASSPY
jgi:hypothetical protein